MFKWSKGEILGIVLLCLVPGVGGIVACALGALILGSGVLRLTTWISLTGVWVGVGAFGVAMVAIMLGGEDPDASIKSVMYLAGFIGGIVGLIGVCSLIWPPEEPKPTAVERFWANPPPPPPELTPEQKASLPVKRLTQYEIDNDCEWV